MKQRTVYLIDDESALVELHSEIVELAGLNAVGFTNANDFFEQITEFDESSILILDLHMPQMDGIEVMRRLAQTINPPALILMSGRDIGVLHSAEKLCRAHGLEILISLSKPVSFDTLRQVLEQHNPDIARIKKNKQRKVDSELTLDDLQLAIREEQLHLLYQPQIEVSTGKLIGVEALVRWRHPQQGLIHLENFILQAERQGLMGELTHWVIDRAVKQQQQWQQTGISLRVSVNISATDITSLVLPEQLANLLEDNQLDPSLLTLEVTESALMGELVTSLDILTRLRLKGVGLSIDDFGTGYSSLSQLHRVPFTELKIDRSFVSNMVSDQEAYAIVKTCIVLGHELNMHIVAEGVESETHLDLLKKLGCDVAQGYYFAKPMPGVALIEWAQAHG